MHKCLVRCMILKKGYKKMSRIRININVTEEQKAIIQARANAMDMTITDFILSKTLDNPQRQSDDLVEQYKLRIMQLTQEVDKLSREIEYTREQSNRVYEMAKLSLINNLPFWKRVFTKTKEIENK
jgi:uncharacterized protein (DUF1778 family)